MGLSDSKPERLDSEQRSQREKVKIEVTAQRKSQLNEIQSQILSSSSSSSTALTRVDAVNLIKVTEKAKSQLDRGGSVLTKADLVAILIALQPEARDRITQLEQMTTSDLNCMIRTNIYDPSRLLTNSTNSTNSTISNAVLQLEVEK